MVKVSMSGVVTALLLGVAATALSAGCSSGDGDGDGDGGGSDHTSSGSGDPGTGGAAPDCATGCQELGFATGAVESEACVCDEPVDEECFLGMSAVCTCNESINQPCSSDEAFNFYVNCFQGAAGTRELLLCVAGYVDGTTIDCDAANEGCVE